MKGNEQVKTFNVQLRKYDTKNRSYLKKKEKKEPIIVATGTNVF